METEKKVLTKREKRLVFIAICFAILTIMILLVIIPLNNRLSSSREEYNELTIKHSQLEIALATEESVRTGYANALALFEHMRMTYESETLSSDIGLILTQTVKEHNLTPISQSISPPKDFIIGADDSNVSDESDEEAIFSSMSVSMVVSGQYSNVKRLVDSIEKSDYIRVSDVTITFIKSESGFVDTDRINIRFEVIMLKNTTAEEEEEEQDIADILDM